MGNHFIEGAIAAEDSQRKCNLLENLSKGPEFIRNCHSGGGASIYSPRSTFQQRCRGQKPGRVPRPASTKTPANGFSPTDPAGKADDISGDDGVRRAVCWFVRHSVGRNDL